MKPWEREIIEYRPYIGLHRDILTKIITRKKEEEGYSFQPTAVVLERTKYLGADLVRNMLANLSTAYQLIDEIESRIGFHPTMQAYQEARNNGDYIRAREIYEDNLTSIDGISELDCYPILLDLIDEMEDYLNYITDELYQKDIDYSHLEDLRKQEEDYLVSLLDIEAEDLKVIDIHLTPQQEALIERMIQDPDSTIRSKEDYIRYLKQAHRQSGSHRIDYLRVIHDTQHLAAMSEKVNMFQKGLEETKAYLSKNLQTFVYDDKEGALFYLVEEQPRLSDFAEMLKLSHSYYADQALSANINMLRVADREIREMLDQKMSQIRKMKDRWDPYLSEQSPHASSEGASSYREAIFEGVQAVDHLWKYIITEQIGTAELVVDQFETMYRAFDQKKRHQILHKFATLVRDEFDFNPKVREKELRAFFQRHSI